MKINSTDIKYRQLNDFIRGEMKKKKIKQKQIAYRLNLPEASISYRFSGETEWTAREIIIVFEMLGVDVNWNY